MLDRTLMLQESPLLRSLATANPRRLAMVLLGLTAAYNVAEGIIAIGSGLVAGSLTLVAFGADSYLEVAAATAVIWRLTFTDDEDGEAAEARVLRFIGWTFLVLAAAVSLEAAHSLASHHEAESSPVGILLLAFSLALMPLLSLSKLWVAARGRIPALAAEAKETVACSYLSFTTLAGLIATPLLGFWWLDAAGALLLVPWLVREGLEGVRGDACFAGSRPCFCRTCLGGLRDCNPTVGCCAPACC